MYLKNLASELEIDLSECGNFIRMLQVNELEHTLDFEAIEKARIEVVKRLNQQLPSEDVSEILTQSLYYRLERTTPFQYFSFLKKKLDENEINTDDISALHEYMKMLNLFETIQKDEVIKEADNLSINVKAKLYTSSDQRLLADFEEYLTLLRAFYYLEMTREKLHIFYSNPHKLSMDKLVAFIRKMEKHLNVSFQINQDVFTLDKDISALERFYNIANERDRAIVDNAIENMNKEKADAAILVAGGFHTEGMTKLFKERGISYVVISPRIAKIQVKTPYVSIMQDERSALEQLVQVSKKHSYAKEDDKEEHVEIAQSHGTASEMLSTMIINMDPQELTDWLKRNPNLIPEVRALVLRKLETIELFDIVSKGLFELFLSIQSWEEAKRSEEGTPVGLAFKISEEWLSRFEGMLRGLPEAERTEALARFSASSNSIRVYADRIEKLEVFDEKLQATVSMYFIPMTIAGVQMGIVVPSDTTDGEDIPIMDQFEQSVISFEEFQTRRLVAMLADDSLNNTEALQLVARDLYVNGTDIEAFLNAFKGKHTDYAETISAFLETYDSRNFQLGFFQISNKVVNKGIASEMEVVEHSLQAGQVQLDELLVEGQSAFISSDNGMKGDVLFIGKQDLGEVSNSDTFNASSKPQNRLIRQSLATVLPIVRETRPDLASILDGPLSHFVIFYGDVMPRDVIAHAGRGTDKANMRRIYLNGDAIFQLALGVRNGDVVSQNALAGLVLRELARLEGATSSLAEREQRKIDSDLSILRILPEMMRYSAKEGAEGKPQQRYSFSLALPLNSLISSVRRSFMNLILVVLRPLRNSILILALLRLLAPVSGIVPYVPRVLVALAPLAIGACTRVFETYPEDAGAVSTVIEVSEDFGETSYPDRGNEPSPACLDEENVSLERVYGDADLHPVNPEAMGVYRFSYIYPSTVELDAMDLEEPSYPVTLVQENNAEDNEGNLLGMDMESALVPQIDSQTGQEVFDVNGEPIMGLAFSIRADEEMPLTASFFLIYLEDADGNAYLERVENISREWQSVFIPQSAIKTDGDTPVALDLSRIVKRQMVLDFAADEALPGTQGAFFIDGWFNPEAFPSQDDGGESSVIMVSSDNFGTANGAEILLNDYDMVHGPNNNPAMRINLDMTDGEEAAAYFTLEDRDLSGREQLVFYSVGGEVAPERFKIRLQGPANNEGVSESVDVDVVSVKEGEWTKHTIFLGRNIPNWFDLSEVDQLKFVFHPEFSEEEIGSVWIDMNIQMDSVIYVTDVTDNPTYVFEDDLFVVPDGSGTLSYDPVNHRWDAQLIPSEALPKAPVILESSQWSMDGEYIRVRVQGDSSTEFSPNPFMLVQDINGEWKLFRVFSIRPDTEVQGEVSISRTALENSNIDPDQIVKIELFVDAALDDSVLGRTCGYFIDGLSYPEVKNLEIHDAGAESDIIVDDLSTYFDWGDPDQLILMRFDTRQADGNNTAPLTIKYSLPEIVPEDPTIVVAGQLLVTPGQFDGVSELVFSSRAIGPEEGVDGPKNILMRFMGYDLDGELVSYDMYVTAIPQEDGKYTYVVDLDKVRYHLGEDTTFEVMGFIFDQDVVFDETDGTGLEGELVVDMVFEGGGVKNTTIVLGAESGTVDEDLLIQEDQIDQFNFIAVSPATLTWDLVNGRWQFDAEVTEENPVASLVLESIAESGAFINLDDHGDYFEFPIESDISLNQVNLTLEFTDVNGNTVIFELEDLEIGEKGIRVPLSLVRAGGLRQDIDQTQVVKVELKIADSFLTDVWPGVLSLRFGGFAPSEIYEEPLPSISPPKRGEGPDATLQTPVVPQRGEDSFPSWKPQSFEGFDAFVEGKSEKGFIDGVHIVNTSLVQKSQKGAFVLENEGDEGVNLLKQMEKDGGIVLSVASDPNFEMIDKVFLEVTDVEGKTVTIPIELFKEKWNNRTIESEELLGVNLEKVSRVALAVDSRVAQNRKVGFAFRGLIDPTSNISFGQVKDSKLAEITLACRWISQQRRKSSNGRKSG
ncbi:MAG: hypothetical protein P9M03_07840 [Candidatus Theseobacter exili]|nr:hypothetical protein [Candidatus Theseobacter exili]